MPCATSDFYNSISFQKNGLQENKIVKYRTEDQMYEIHDVETNTITSMSKEAIFDHSIYGYAIPRMEIDSSITYEKPTASNKLINTFDATVAGAIFLAFVIFAAVVMTLGVKQLNTQQADALHQKQVIVGQAKQHLVTPKAKPAKKDNQSDIIEIGSGRGF